MERKKKLRLIQISLLIFATTLVYYTYYQKNENFEESIVTQKTQDKINKTSSQQSSDGDIFYDISYSGLDLNGNRYILKSKEAVNDKVQNELVKMKMVEATFYFKDGTILNITSDKGIYNNLTLDIKFENNIKAFYENSSLSAENAEYSNSENYLEVTEKVVIKDIRGEMTADKIYFDLEKNTLDIASFSDKKIKASVNLK